MPSLSVNQDYINNMLNALSLCGNEETAYQISADPALHIMTYDQLFHIARYLEHRGFHTSAHKVAMIGMKKVRLAYNQDTDPAINDIHWACALSHSLGKSELTNMIPLLVKNVQCASILSDILRRCTMRAPGVSCPGHHHHHQRGSTSNGCDGEVELLSYDQPPLRQLLEAAIAAYVITTHSQMMHISPRHYGDFIEFLGKARDTFVLAYDGHAQFAQLVENIKVANEDKEELVLLLNERFG